MNKNPNNDPRRQNQRNNNNRTVYKSERPVNTNNSGYTTKRRNVNSANDATRVIPAVKNTNQNPNNAYTHDPNALYKTPPPSAVADETKTTPVVRQQPTNGNPPAQQPANRPSKYAPPPHQDQSTRAVPIVKPQPQQPQQRLQLQQDQRQNNQPVVRRKQPPSVQNTGNMQRRPSGGNPNAGRKSPQQQRRTNPNTGRTRNSNDSAAPAVLSNVMKAVIYIVAVVIFSVFLSVFTIYVANDVFAFVKNDIQMDITISEYDNTSDIASKLFDFGVIKYPTIFRWYAQLRNQDENYAGGTYTVSPSMNYDQLFIELKGKNVVRDQVSITIREGWTVNEIIDLFVSKDMGSRAEFVDVINNYDFDYEFVKALTDLHPSRTYRLEGYLFPDTYWFFTDSSEIAIIDKLLSNFDKKFVQEYREYVKGTEYTIDDMVILASLIQAEARYAEEYGNISSVFHNRLKNPGFEYIGGRLQCDATVQYVLTERTENLTAADLEIDNPYNTRVHAGLPPGPIGNPSLNAIHFALEPNDTNYYYFVSYPGGTTAFSATNAEHELNKAIIAGTVTEE